MLQNILDIQEQFHLPTSQLNLLIEYIQEQTSNTSNKTHTTKTAPKILRKIVKQLKENVPVEYITKFTYFYNTKIYTRTSTDKAYIPSPFTERLVTKTLEAYTKIQDTTNANETYKNTLFLDIGTGTSAILIALFQEIQKMQETYKMQKIQNNKLLKHTSFIGTDINESALKVANLNLTKHNLQNHIKLIRANIAYCLNSQEICPTIQDAIKKAKNIFITYNKPYVAQSEYKKLPKNMYHYPKIALVQNAQTDQTYRKFITWLKKMQNNLPKNNTKNIYIIMETASNNKKHTPKIIQTLLSKKVVPVR